MFREFDVVLGISVEEIFSLFDIVVMLGIIFVGFVVLSVCMLGFGEVI